MSFVSFIDTTKLRIKFGLTAILLIGFIYGLIEIIYYKTKSTLFMFKYKQPKAPPNRYTPQPQRYSPNRKNKIIAVF